MTREGGALYPIEGSEFFVPADMVIPSIGQAPDLSFLPPTRSWSASAGGPCR